MPPFSHRMQLLQRNQAHSPDLTVRSEVTGLRQECLRDVAGVQRRVAAVAVVEDEFARLARCVCSSSVQARQHPSHLLPVLALQRLEGGLAGVDAARNKTPVAIPFLHHESGNVAASTVDQNDTHGVSGAMLLRHSADFLDPRSSCWNLPAISTSKAR